VKIQVWNIKKKKNPLNKSQGEELIHQKYKANKSMNKHKPKKKMKANNERKKEKILCK
jgi:hypothetical protein